MSGNLKNNVEAIDIDYKVYNPKINLPWIYPAVICNLLCKPSKYIKGCIFSHSYFIQYNCMMNDYVTKNPLG